MQGEITIPHRIDEIYSTDQAPYYFDYPTNVFVQEGNYGGASKQSYKSMDNSFKQFSDYLTLEVDSESRTSTRSWNIPQMEAYFGDILLFSNIEEANWFINFTVKGKPYFRGRPGSMQISITSMEDDVRFGNYYSAILPKLRIKYE